ncbi:MAG: type II secretion system protein [Prosthecobacter sp.]|nr:type II secretion system protein [Prosthecobacter sp.]
MTTLESDARRWRSGFTLVEIVIAMTIVVIITAASIPAFRGLRDQQIAREPIQELVRMAKEARIRAMREKRPYQVAFYGTGFTASRYFNPYLQLADLNLYLEESETGVSRLNPNADDNEADLDAGASTTAKTQLPLAPVGPKLDDHWTEKYVLPENTHYSIKFWHEIEEIPIEGEVVKLWVFQPSGICQPLKIHLERQPSTFDVEFGALTADIVREVINVQ